MRKVLQVTLRSLEKYKFLDQMFETWKGFVFSWTLIFAFLLQLSGKKKLWKYIKEWEKKWKKPKDLSRQWTYSIFIVFWKGKRKISWNCMTVVKEIMFIHTVQSTYIDILYIGLFSISWMKVFLIYLLLLHYIYISTFLYIVFVISS